MVFSSPVFIFLFLPIVYLINLVLPKRFSNGFLLLFSLIFYAWGEPLYVF
jgi:alginate O-acetyltransferase complex protein AlgI